MLALTLAFAAVLHLTGIRADRALTKPGEHPPSLTSLGVDLASPGSVSEGSYRGKSAPYWAWRFKKRTKQLHTAQRSLRYAISQPRYTSPLEAAFMCIHGHEGRWDDPNPPFFGGVQMDWDFMRHYGDWALAAFGTADHWPVSVQLAVAIRAKVSGRGFYPWPNTARYCGLI